MAHQELVESTQTDHSTGFQANTTKLQQSTVDAIANLTNVTMTDRESMAALTQNINYLTVKLANSNTKLVQVLSANNILSHPGNVYCTHYCNTHGIQDRKTTVEGHTVEVTDTIRMGGCTIKWKTVYRE